MKYYDIIIVGGGAAGYFTAINAAINNPKLSIGIVEQSKEVLNKVRISGGGRCNVTHACYDPKLLTTYYPRGGKELLGPFHVFGPAQSVEWFSRHGVTLKTESDGRMFPVTDSSETIIQAFKTLVRKYDIDVILQVKVKDFLCLGDAEGPRFEVMAENAKFSSNSLMFATGSSPFIWDLLHRKGYEVIAPVPSLFTFNLPKHPITKLMGLSVPKAVVRLQGSKITTEGPLLITHWGLSGPAVLKASAWGASYLDDKNYECQVIVDWLPEISKQEILDLRNEWAKKKVMANPAFGLPSRLWQFFVKEAITDIEKNWASLSKTEMAAIVSSLKESNFQMKGKTTFKEEFVTAGGVALRQINFKTFESKLHPGLYIAGETLNIDAVTGGFNFQAAWTGGYIAAQAMTSSDI